MNETFRGLVESLEPTFQALMSMSPVQFGALPRTMPERGIYLFSDGTEHLYVGRTNRIRKRIQGHCRPGGEHTNATFAFRIARLETGRLKATYTKAGSREELCLDPVFGPAFDAAKRRLASLDIRFVEESEPVRQALLEIYVATVLRTPFNDFDNH